MDVQRFRDSREKELSDFKKQYSFLKTEYSSTLQSAIAESDPAKQSELITQVLTLNSSMAAELRDIIAKLNQGAQGFDPKELNDLTNELIQYQKDYEEIEQSKDKVNTLKRIHETNKEILKKENTWYTLYIGIIIILLFVVAYLVFKTEWARKMVPTLPTTLSQ
jgi:DNA repair exonuclease SbcCD ATPase subunit